MEVKLLGQALSQSTKYITPMKAKLLLILLSLGVLAACNKDNGDDNPACPAPSFSAGAGQNSVQVVIDGSEKYGFFEAEYGSNGYALGNGDSTATINNYQHIGGIPPGTYDIYVRGNCGGSEWSEWSGPKSFLVQ